jgi:hypothetical protein
MSKIEKGGYGEREQKREVGRIKSKIEKGGYGEKEKERVIKGKWKKSEREGGEGAKERE